MNKTEPKDFVFVCVPESYNLEAELRAGHYIIPWVAKAHKKYLRPGRRVFLWQGKKGPDHLAKFSGLHAIAKIIEGPRPYTDLELDNYGVPKSKRRLDDDRVLLSVIKYAPRGGHIRREIIEEVSEAQSPSRFIGQQGVNFQLDKNAAETLSRLWDNNVESIAVGTNVDVEKSIVDSESKFENQARDILEREANLLRCKTLEELATMIAENEKLGQSSSNRKMQVAGRIRDAAVVMYARKRAGDQCEVQDCSVVSFKKKDGYDYTEVHHIHYLGQGGDDTIENVACLCPVHHREVHHGSQGDEINNALAALRLKD